MNPKKLLDPENGEVLGFACGRCRTPFSFIEGAEQCCVCRGCGAVGDKICSACFHKATWGQYEKRMKALMENEVTDWDGPLCDSNQNEFFTTKDEAIQAMIDDKTYRPPYFHPCAIEKTHVRSLFHELFVTDYGINLVDLNGYITLREAIEKFEADNQETFSYLVPDEEKCVILKVQGVNI